MSAKTYPSAMLMGLGAKEKLATLALLLFVLSVGAFLPVASADTLFYYKGPDFSPGQMFVLTDFRVDGPTVPRAGDTLTVSFTLACQVPPDYPLGPKGIFAAVRDADGSVRDFGFLRPNQQLKQGDVMHFNATITADESGLWAIWPSYQIDAPNGMVYGPDYWHAANIPLEEPLMPDLMILDIIADPANSRVGFTVANTGNATAASPFSVRLLVGQQAFFETVSQGLAPGSQRSSWFYGYTWPENTNITATVTADHYNAVAESNEGNNALTEHLTRHAEVLRITQGPTAIVLDQDTVIIQWVTNLDSNSSVSYGMTKLPDMSKGNSTSSKSHYMTLDKLSDGTTYSFFVTSWDYLGQKATSKQFTFETPPAPDGKAPSLYIPPWAGNLSGIVDVLPQASDEGGVDRLLFYIDGILKFTDYSPPFIWKINTTGYPDGSYNLTVVAIDRYGNRASSSVDSPIDNPEGDSRGPAVTIISPAQGTEVWGSVRIEALALDVGLYGEETGHIREAQLLIDGVLTRTWVYTPFRFNPITGEIETHTPSSSMELLHFWDASMLAAGSNHTVEVRAWDDSGNMGNSIHNISITKIEAYAPSLGLNILDLEYSRTVVRHGNWFEVTVSVRNTGTVPLYDFMIMEFCAGFQIVSLPMPSTSLDNVFYRDFARDSFISFESMAGNLTSGEVWEISYYAVPILYEPGEGFTDSMYQIGYQTTLVCNMWRVNEVYENPYAPALRDEDGNGVNDLEDAFRAVDYLIVTNPTRLDDFNPADGRGVDLLLQDAATLAKAKNGVLGYLTSVSSPSDLRALIVPDGAWASRLAYCFQNPYASNAYLLLVGETEIVPAYTYNVTGLEIWWNGGGHTVACRLSDNYYADTCWDSGRPDIVVGRIIGDNVRNMIKPIEVSLQVYLGLTPPRNKALGVSGYEDGDWDVFVNDALAFEEQMSSHGFASDSIHWSILMERAWTVHFDDDDIFVLGDVDGDALDEVVVARDEDDRIYIYEVIPRDLIRSFPATITPNDGLTAGDYDGDGQDEIAVAVNGEPGGGMLYIYEPDGTLIGSWPVSFGDSYCIDSGDIWENAGSPETRDEVVIGDPVEDLARVYELYFDTWTDELVLRENNFDLVIDLTRYDGFAVGDFTPDWARDEVAIIRDDNEHIYVYNIHDFISSIGTVVPNQIGFYDKENHNAVKYTPYDGFAAGDVNGDGLDDMVVLSDNDDKTYVYYRDTVEGKWKWYSMYSQYWDYWFQGVRYNGEPSRHDGFDIGAFESGESALMAVLFNNFGDSSSFQLFAASWPEADEWANERLTPATTDVSLLMIHGHGNPSGPSPTGAPWKGYWDFTNAPIVFAWSCLAGYYEGSDDFCFGDALLSSGALAFVGSTEVSAISVNHEATNEFYWDNWDIGYEYLGAALKDYKRVVFGGDNYWKLFVYEYNYYGDPKVVR
jgi:hypothetical protein